MDCKNNPLPFCYSIQDTINSVIVSRSCTHVLIQVKDYASNLNTKLFWALLKSNPFIKGLDGSIIWTRKEGEKKHQELCVQVVGNNESLGLFIY